MVTPFSISALTPISHLRYMIINVFHVIIVLISVAQHKFIASSVVITPLDFCF